MKTTSSPYGCPPNGTLRGASSAASVSRVKRNWLSPKVPFASPYGLPALARAATPSARGEGRTRGLPSRSCAYLVRAAVQPHLLANASVEGIRIVAVSGRHDHNPVPSLHQRPRQRPAHIAQPAGLGPGRDLGGHQHDTHSARPRLAGEHFVDAGLVHLRDVRRARHRGSVISNGRCGG
eukprot:scaffold3611_cov364-Prasinococcus_capsulatus_cf.AAC.11